MVNKKSTGAHRNEPKGFNPVYTITPELASLFMELEKLRQEIDHLPCTPRLLAGLRESARLASVHYSTQIEGNRLSQAEVTDVIKYKKSIPGKQRDAKEAEHYFAALTKAEHFAERREPFTDTDIQILHALVMGTNRHKKTPYRDGQNVIRDGRTGAIVYLPPQASDVQKLMDELLMWITATENQKFPCPLRAALAHYQFVTIHPFYDGNGRVARLIATLILHRCGYGLKGIYSLEAYYAHDRGTYYEAMSVGPSHNYYEGRETADLTNWITYFCQGMRDSFEAVKRQASQQQGLPDLSKQLQLLTPQQRLVLGLFKNGPEITTNQVAALLQIHPRTASTWCKQWCEQKFLVVAHASKKRRSFSLAPQFVPLLAA